MVLILAVLETFAHAVTRPLHVSAFPAEFPHRAFDTTDALGRSMHFYLSDAETRDERPLILIMQGTLQLPFDAPRQSRRRRLAQLCAQSNQRSRAGFAGGKARLELFDMPENPGGGANCTEEFRREQTGERWLEALTAALNAVDELRRAAPRALMVLGQSEGAVFAPRLAVQDKRVTHVAALASSPSRNCMISSTWQPPARALPQNEPATKPKISTAF